MQVDLAGGELAARARQQNQAFRKHARTGRPWVLFKSAMSLDGKVATKTGDSKWISTEDSRARRAPLARRRATPSPSASAPRWPTTRSSPRASTASRHQPRRVVFDATARLPLDSKLVSAAHEVPLVVVVSRAARRSNTDALENAGAEVIVATGEHEPARVRSALDQLGALDPPVTSVLLEGGPHLAGAFLDAGEIDELRLFIAPLLLGGRSARDPLEGEGVDAISDALRALTLDCEHGRRATSCSPRACGSGRRLFTGLVADLGTVAEVHSTNDGVRLAIESPLARELSEGDSVAVNGVCLTAVGLCGDRFGADVMHETLRRSSLAEVRSGHARQPRAARWRANARLGGHFVQGHVDGVGAVGAVREDGFARVVTVEADPALLRYVVEKGSITVDGVSLTVARIDDASFDVSLIPETLERTNLGDRRTGHACQP